MTTGRIALLLNALVMPGSGQILIGQRRKGILISVLAALLAALPLVRYTISVMTALREAAHASRAAASNLRAFSAAWEADRSFILWCLALLAAVWIYAIVDLLVLRRKDSPRSSP